MAHAFLILWAWAGTYQGAADVAHAAIVILLIAGAWVLAGLNYPRRPPMRAGNPHRFREPSADEIATRIRYPGVFAALDAERAEMDLSVKTTLIGRKRHTNPSPP